MRRRCAECTGRTAFRSGRPAPHRSTTSPPSSSTAAGRFSAPTDWASRVRTCCEILNISEERKGDEGARGYRWQAIDARLRVSWRDKDETARCPTLGAGTTAPLDRGDARCRGEGDLDGDRRRWHAGSVDGVECVLSPDVGDCRGRYR